MTLLLDDDGGEATSQNPWFRKKSLIPPSRGQAAGRRDERYVGWVETQQIFNSLPILVGSRPNLHVNGGKCIPRVYYN